MKRIGIIIKKNEPDAVSAVRHLLRWLKNKDFEFFIESEAASLLKMKGYPRKEIPLKSDIIIAFGGDGTLLGAINCKSCITV